MNKIFGKNQLMITALALMIAVAGYLHFSGNISDQITVMDEKNADSMEALNLTEYDDSELVTVDDAQAMLEGDDATAGLADLTGDADTDSALAETSYAGSDLVDIDSLDEDLDLAAAEEGYEDELAQVDASALQESSSALEAASSDVESGEVPGEAVFTSTINVNTLQGAKLLKEQTRAENKQALLDIINNTNIVQEQKQTAVDSMVSLTSQVEKEMSAEILLNAKGFTDAVVSITGETADVVVYGDSLNDSQRAQIEDIVERKTGVMASNIVISTTLN